MREIASVVFFCEYNRQTDSFGNYGFISPYITLQGAKRDIYVRDKCISLPRGKHGRSKI